MERGALTTERGRPPASAPIPVTIRALAAGGDGVGELPDGRVVFVPRTLPGEEVLVKVEQRARAWARGRALELVEPSPSRQRPPCPLYDRCGGCALQHVRYEEQLAWKARWVADALERIGGVAVDVPEVTSAAPLRYRSRMTYHVRRLAGGRIVAGPRALRHPQRVVDMTDECVLPEPGLLEVWRALRAGWGDGGRRLPGGPALRLTLWSVEGGAALLVEDGRGRGLPEELVREVPGLTAVWARDGRGARRLAPGNGRSRDEDDAVRGSTPAFRQVNRAAADLLYGAVLREVDPAAGLRVVDAYCGVAELGRSLARSGARVTGIELDADAVREAARDAPDGFRVIAGRVEDRLGDALPADVVLVNPPRRGLDERVIARLEASGVGRVVYVSCDAATLARDVERLSPAYTPAHVSCFDLFPQTPHVETLLTLVRSPSAPASAP